jgi:putative glutamine amidotransferase
LSGFDPATMRAGTARGGGTPSRAVARGQAGQSSSDPATMRAGTARGEAGQSSPSPLIGLTTYLEQAQTGVWDVRASFLPAVYFQGITAAGGVAMLLPPQPVDPDIAERVLDGLDGLLITGGKDVDPAAYGHQPHPATDQPGRQRDAWEFTLLGAAIKRGLPVLGICRGAQVLNVALGGTLHQHLPDVIGHSGHRAGNAVFNTVSVRTVADTRLAALVGESVEVKCYHHQAIAEVGEGLIVSAWDADGVIEALELPGNGFVLAVQWHPEESLDDLRLFSAIVEAARSYASGRVSR